MEKQYVDFAEHYTKNIAPSVITSLFNCVIESYMKKEYVSDRVLYLALNYLSQAINQAQLWQMIKPNFDVTELTFLEVSVLYFSKFWEELFFHF